MTKKKLFLTNVLVCAFAGVAAPAGAQDVAKYPWLDVSKSFHERAVLLCKELTLQEKVDQLGNLVSSPVVRDGVTILPSYQYWNEAIHGVARSGAATSFPESKAMSSTWDRQLIYDCANAVSDEARIYYLNKNKGLNYWSPTINMARDPRWGREEENYGEDPFLAGELAVQFIRAFQGEQTAENPYLKLVACAKHYAANNYEQGRHSCTSFVTERNMREYYLPAFEACVREGGVKSIMSAYNAFSIDIAKDVNGVGLGPSTGSYKGYGGLPCSANKMLLTDILRKEWGFDGYVTSDCAAVSDIHRAAKHTFFGSYDANDPEQVSLMEARSASMCLKAGLNTNCEFMNQTSVLQRAGVNAANPAFAAKDNMGYVGVTEEDIDNALIPMLETRFALGEFEKDRCPWNNVANTLESEANQAMALKAACEAITLMKNDGGLLPITTDKKVALIGPYANQIMLGDYSGTPTYTVTPYEAFSKKLGFELSSDTRSSNIQAVPFDEAVVSKRGAANNDKGKGNLENTAPGDIFLYRNVDFGEHGCTNFEMSCGAKSSGLGSVSFILDSQDGTPFLTVDNKETGSWTKWATVTATVDPAVVNGKHDLYVKFSGTNSYVGNYLYFNFWNPDYEQIPPIETQGPLFMCETSANVNTRAPQNMIDRAVEVAKRADVVIFLGGTNFDKPDDHATGTESHDRFIITLPGNQEEVLKAVYAANPNTVLVLETGSSMDISWAKANLPAILEAWYGGQAQGQAICDVIYGDVNPSGKLTSTWYNSIDELPNATDSKFGRNGLMEYNIDEWGYTYMYYGKSKHQKQAAAPMFPFGFGLSYTTFEYADMNLSRQSIAKDQIVDVLATVKNTGTRDGAEVVQLYANFNGRGNNANLNKRLVGFERVELKAGESKTVTIPVCYAQLSYFNETAHNYQVDGGTVTLELAASSADVRLTADLNTTAGVAKETYISENESSIETVKTAASLKSTDHVYSVMGAYVCPASEYDSLPAGIYVLNGHKYIKKTR